MNVQAIQYKTAEIFPANEPTSVFSETFDYTNFSFVPAKAGSKYGTVNFESITNKTEKSIPVSINLLMFNSSKKNIGYITYCSTKDISSDYSQMKIKANATTPFSITVSDTYFAGGYSAKDIAYFAVLDDNKYCQIGGYDKYKGMTIEEISNMNYHGVSESVLPSSAKFNISKFIRTVILILVLVIGGKYLFKYIINHKDSGLIPKFDKDEDSNGSIINNNAYNDNGSQNEGVTEHERTTFIKENFSKDSIIDLNYKTSSPDENNNTFLDNAINNNFGSNDSMSNNFGSSDNTNDYFGPDDNVIDNLGPTIDDGSFNSVNPNLNNNNNNNNTNNVNNSRDGESDLANLFK